MPEQTLTATIAWSDEIPVPAGRGGPGSAVADLYDRVGPASFGYARHLCGGDEEIAADAVAAAFSQIDAEPRGDDGRVAVEARLVALVRAEARARRPSVPRVSWAEPSPRVLDRAAPVDRMVAEAMVLRGLSLAETCELLGMEKLEAAAALSRALRAVGRDTA